MNVHTAPGSTAAVAPAAGTAGALILGGAHGSLAVARSLGRLGVRVFLVTNDHPIVRFSRYVTRSFAWAGPHDPGAVRYLLDLAREHGLDGWVLFAGGDAEMTFAARHEAELASTFRLTTPPWDQARWGHDKRLTYERAASLGIAIPQSAYPRSRDEVKAIAGPFPVILKPTVHDRRNAFTQAKAWRADDPATLLTRYDQAAALVGPEAIVVQELIPGRGSRQFSYAAVCDRGTPVASLVARRTRQYPIDFGYTSTCVESVEQPEVEDAARRLLRSIGYSGLVEVEFKYDVRDRRYKILDVNMRAWTWIGLGALAGVDFPAVAWRLALGETQPSTRGRAGVAWQHFARDLLAFAGERWAGSLSTRAYVATLRQPRVFAAFAKDDPIPGLVELPLVAGRVAARRWRQTRPLPTR